MATTEDNGEIYPANWSGRQRIFYLKSPRFVAGAIAVTLWTLIAAWLRSTPSVEWMAMPSLLIVLLAVIGCTKAPTKDHRWNELA